MIKRHALSAFAVLLLLFANTAAAFIDPPYLTPEHPAVGDTVSVNIRAGICDGIGSIPGYPRISQEGNQIHIVVWSVTYTDSTLCNLPIGTNTIAVGAFPAGSYTLRVDRDYFGSGDVVVTENLGTLPFTVGGGGGAPEPIAAPTLSVYGITLLLLGLGGVACWKRRRDSIWLVVALIALPMSVRGEVAQPPNHVVELLLTTAPGAPTPQSLVDYYARPIGAPPLTALSAVRPTRVEYLIPTRAEGDFLARLQANPNSVRAQLERYLLVVYPDGANLELAVAALRADPYVASAQEPLPMRFSSVDLIDFGVDGLDGYDQYGRGDLNVDTAWGLTGGGYALVADIDSGLYTNHAALRQFSGTQYVNGNFVAVASLDIGGTGVGISDDANVDELEPVLISDPACSPGGPSMMTPVLAGHGTHTSGLLAANQSAGLGVAGTCAHCGIAMLKVTYAACFNNQVVPIYNRAANSRALLSAGDFGAQVATMSFGDVEIQNYCGGPPGSKSAMCAAIAHAKYRDVAMVGASGNDRSSLQFPANDDRVISAGGFQADLTLWDESPGSIIHCPLLSDEECGSNYTVPANGARQELMGSAKAALSTTYPGVDWNPYLQCGDNFGPGGGLGLCTGTSMSAPQVAGIVALVRSINPLVAAGKPTFNPLTDPAATLRYVIASTTAQAQAGQGWTTTMGYGRPDAAAAARKMLGKVAGVYIRNRATPLFRLYATVTHDYADTTSPQTAVALMINQKNAWSPPTNIPLVPNYPAFPQDPTDPPLAAPRASVYVMTTATKPRAEWPDLAPLYLMDKMFSSGRDFMLVTTVNDIQLAHSDGYSLRTIQGYIYKPCTPEPACIPPGVQKFWRKCKTADNDCATFLESERGVFEAALYTSVYPAGSNALLGYAYPATDTDGDGLPDGFEYVVGTSPTRANSDNDTSPDASEFPMVGVPVSDPCGGVGSSGAQYCLANSIFKNGFDPI